MFKAFHQIALDDASKVLATFPTPRGMRRCTTLVMGFSSSSEILQRVMQNVLGGLPGVRWAHDDIIVFGSSFDEHDVNLERCLQRLKDFNITLNRKKCEFRLRIVRYTGKQL